MLQECLAKYSALTEKSIIGAIFNFELDSCMACNIDVQFCKVVWIIIRLLSITLFLSSYLLKYKINMESDKNNM